MSFFEPSFEITVAFVAVCIAAAALFLWIVWVSARAAARSARRAALAAALGVAVWMGLHAAVAASGVLEGGSMPPRVMPYFLGIITCAILLVVSRVGRMLSRAPMALLIGFHSFRLPLEMVLHALYEEGMLPQQMTWSGYNFDVVTGATALVLALVAIKQDLPQALVWIWNVLGLGLLVNVVTIAMLSAPVPFRQFMEDPPAVLVFFAPYNWIATVCVFGALVGHLVIFRKLLS